MAGRYFGRGERAVPGQPVTSIPAGATGAGRLPSADVVKGMDDERAVRKLRRRMRFWRLLRRVR